MSADAAAHGDVLGIELRFRPHGSPEVWATTLAALFAWEPGLWPSHVDRLTDAGADEPEPWSEDRVAELARRCAGAARSAWLLFKENDPSFGLMVTRHPVEIEMSIAVPRPAGDVPGCFLRLLHALEGGALPALGMAFDRHTADDEFIMQGLVGLEGVPPLLYLDALAVERLGGADWLRAAPAHVLAAPGEGLLLISRAALWGTPTPQEQARTRAVQAHLAITPARPLVLAGDEP